MYNDFHYHYLCTSFKVSLIPQWNSLFVPLLHVVLGQPTLAAQCLFAQAELYHPKYHLKLSWHCVDLVSENFKLKSIVEVLCSINLIRSLISEKLLDFQMWNKPLTVILNFDLWFWKKKKKNLLTILYSL